jgi:hypothetical protein
MPSYETHCPWGLSPYQVAHNAASRYQAAERENYIDQIINFLAIIEYYLGRTIGGSYTPGHIKGIDVHPTKVRVIK